jgi:aryl-alcohol dehydrogenase-like predicted oxidoreductase
MQEFCKRKNVAIFAYGTICGGLLTERYLGSSEPSISQLDTLSLRKYKKMIDYWGGWRLFQELLKALDQIAQKHKSSIANVATRYILDRTAVAGVIIGARLGIAEHRKDNSHTFEIKLDNQDKETIEQVTTRSHDLFALIGDCGDEYRK